MFYHRNRRSIAADKQWRLPQLLTHLRSTVQWGFLKLHCPSYITQLLIHPPNYGLRSAGTNCLAFRSFCGGFSSYLLSEILLLLRMQSMCVMWSGCLPAPTNGVDRCTRVEGLKRLLHFTALPTSLVMPTSLKLGSLLGGTSVLG